mgnify:CR=1 FL=1
MALDDSYYMKQALQEAQKTGERGEVPVGAGCGLQGPYHSSCP